MDNNDTRRRTTTNTEDTVRSTAYARLLKLMRGPADYWDRPAGDWGPGPAGAPGTPAGTARADANSAYRLATKALRRGELDAARAAFAFALAEQHPGAAFRIVLTEPRRLSVSIPTGSGKTESFVWVVKHLMAAARWGHADAQQLLDGIQPHPPRTWERILVDAQRPAPCADVDLWSGYTFICPPLTYEAQDVEFYPTVRDVLAQLLKAPAAALEAGPSSRARALPAGRVRIALPPASGISRKPLDACSGARSGLERPGMQVPAGNGEHTPERSLSGKAALLSALRGFCPGQVRSGQACEQDLGDQLLQSTARAWQGDMFRTAGGVRPHGFNDPFPRQLDCLGEDLVRPFVVILTECSDMAFSSAKARRVQALPDAVWASSSRSAFGLQDPLTGYPGVRPASAWRVAVAADGNVQVWGPTSGLLISCLDRHTRAGGAMPVGSDAPSLPLHDLDSPTAWLECPRMGTGGSTPSCLRSASRRA
ncbi:hypothetical protein AB0K68_24530 [Streptomyces sp. NPDC050698]